MLVLQIPTLILVNRSPAPRAALLTAAICCGRLPASSSSEEAGHAVPVDLMVG
jgi:hypothetical protein